MANTLTNVIPQLLAQGVVTLRENSVMPRLVNSNYSALGAQRGSTIDIPIPTAATVTTVTAANIPPTNANTDIDPDTVPITLDQWKESDFTLTDSEIRQVLNGTIPMSAAEAIKGLANKIDSDLMALYKDIPYYCGTPGTTPFSSSTTEATQARKILNNNSIPLGDRRLVLNPESEANALDLRAFQDMSFSGSASAIIEGKINRKLGFDWFMDQNAPTHTTGAQNGAYLVDGVCAVGANSLTMKTGSGSLKIGDIFTKAGDTQPYVVTADSAGGAVAITFKPSNMVVTVGDEAITFVGDASTTYDHDLAFHRDAFAFVSRPLADEDGLGNIIESVIDPVSGIALRLEVSREHKRTRYSFDILYGLATVRSLMAVRIFGA